MTHLFSPVFMILTYLLNNSDWAYQWKMSFNPDLSKQAQEVIFSRKASRVDHPVVTFNNSPVARTPYQKHLGLYLGERLNFNHQIKEKISKAFKGIGVIRKLHYILPRHSLLTIYKSFIRPHLDYGDIIYDQPNNQAFSNKLEAVQYNAASAITGAIRGTSRIKIYQELGLESLKSRRWFRRLCYFYKIKNYGFPGYLFKLILLDTIHLTLGFLKILQHIVVELISSNILFSHGLLLNGTN